MNLYESILDGSTKQTNNESSNLVTSASIPAILSESKHNNTQLNRFFDSGLMSSPDSSDSGIHSDDLISRHNTLSASTTTEHLSTTSENKTSKDSLYSSVIGSKKSTDSISREMSSLSSRLDSEEFDEENYNHLEQNELPLGWIRCCDETGVYYWHKPSGTVTRKPPAVPNKTETAEQIAPKLPKKNFKIDEYASFQQINELINGNLSDTNTLLSSSTASTSSTSESKQDMENNYYVNCNESTDDLVNLDSNQSLALNSERKGSNLFHSSSIMSQSLIAKVSQRFYVRSLGWVKIDEDDLTPERSSKAVNKCINDLSRGHKDLNDVVASWGEGKDLYMDLEDGYLILIDTNNYKVLNKQSITSIRVWGVGRDSGRDFAYVARDKQTKIHMCHVFRCDSSPAKEIANTLRDTCRQIISEKKKLKSNETPQKTSHLLKRPNFLPEFLNEKTALQKSASYQDQNELKASIPKSQTEVNSLKFLSPTEEPKKSIKCKYLGSTVVQKPTGIEILNAAIEKIYLQSLEEFKRVKRQYKLKNNAQLKPVSDFFNERNNNEFKDDEDDEEEDYEAYDYPDNAFSFDMPDLNRDKRLGIDVEVIVSPSTVSIKKLAVNDNYNNNTDNSILEFRVRYLSFMGISTDVRLCGFIVHGIDNTFKCHGFLCENSSGSLMKVIEAACRLRYQKCLDAHPGSANDVNSPKSKQNGRFGLLGTQLKGMFDSFKTRNIFSNYNLSELQQPK